MLLVVYLGHGIFQAVTVFMYSPNQILGKVLSSLIEEHRKISGDPRSKHGSRMEGQHGHWMY